MQSRLDFVSNKKYTNCVLTQTYIDVGSYIYTYIDVGSSVWNIMKYLELIPSSTPHSDTGVEKKYLKIYMQLK